MRLPIVAPKLDGIAEILRDNEDALLADPAEASDYANAVARLVQANR